MHLACKSSDKQCKKDDLRLKEETFIASSGRTSTTTITRHGAPLLEMNSFAGEAFQQSDFIYSAPITGVSRAFSFSAGQTMGGNIDGREIVPAALNTPPAKLRFADGRLAPKLSMATTLRKELDKLLHDAEAPAKACEKKQLGARSGSNPKVLALEGTAGHKSDTYSSFGCNGCRLACGLGAAHCNHHAATASTACGPFAVFCFLGGFAGCTTLEIGCLKVCDRNGGFCCPVGCGGEGDSHFPLVVPAIGIESGCCLDGETCLDRSQGLCCSAGKAPCGSTCCGGSDVCVRSPSFGATCCEPQRVCGTSCCGSGQECVSIQGKNSCHRRCKVHGDCGGTSVCGPDGLCGPG